MIRVDRRLAVAAGNFATAAGYYAGPFPDGFFMKDAPEFERWVEEQGSRRAQRAIEVMAGLARGAQDRGGRCIGGAGSRDRSLDPRVALHLVEALATAGDRPGAVRAYGIFILRLDRLHFST